MRGREEGESKKEKIERRGGGERKRKKRGEKGIGEKIRGNKESRDNKGGEERTK